MLGVQKLVLEKAIRKFFENIALKIFPTILYSTPGIHHRCSHMYTHQDRY